jgi:short-subunit dehydrogenase
VLSINLWGVIHGCHFFVPKMVEKKSGHVVNVSSAFGLVAVPDAIGYCTSKFAIVGLSESMRAELDPLGIGVSTICPGIIDTNFVRTARYKRDPESTRARVVSLHKKRAYGPEKVAAAIVSAVKAKKAVVPVSPEAWFAYYVKRLAPALVLPLSRAMRKGTLGG